MFRQEEVEINELRSASQISNHPMVSFSASHVESRCEAMARLGLLRSSGSEDRERRYSPMRINLYFDNERSKLSWRNARLDPLYPPAIWLEPNDLRFLKNLVATDETSSVLDVDTSSTSWNKSLSYFRLTHLGLMQRVGTYRGRITERGERYLSSDLSTIAVVRGTVPRYMQILYWLGERTLSFLSWFDSSSPRQMPSLLSLSGSNSSVAGPSRGSIKTERAFMKAFWWRVPIYGLIFVSLLVLGFIYPSNLQIYGLFADIVGAVAVALGLFRGRQGIMTDTETMGSRMGGGLDPNSLRNTVASTIDGVFGALILVTGFSLQLIFFVIQQPIQIASLFPKVGIPLVIVVSALILAVVLYRRHQQNG